MGVRDDCRHLVQRSTSSGDTVMRCRVSAGLQDPFRCPEGCVFFEARTVAGPGWATGSSAPMTNTADALNALPPAKRRKPRKKRS